MKILYVSQYFPPEMGAPAARAAELARHWTRLGHEATVLTGFPNHPTGVVPPEWRPRLKRLVYEENIEGMRVLRTWLWPLPNRKAHERIRNYSSFFLSAAISGLRLPKQDVVIGTSPQLLVALSGWWLARAKRVPFVFEVRDLWPESLAAVGAGAEGTILHRTLGAIAGFLYRHSDHVVVVTPAFRQHLVERWKVPEEKISVVENGVETELFRPSDIPSPQGNGEKFVICYIGTMGMAHGLETVVRAAGRLQSELPGAVFHLIGEGAEKERVVELAGARKLRNMRFIDQQPRERIPEYISAADVCLVVLRKTELFKTVIPTKLLEYMSCGRPVIVAVDGQARELVEKAGAGVFVEPEDSDALVNAIAALAADGEHRTRMGEDGRKYIVEHLSREQTARKYLSVLERLLGRPESAQIRDERR